MNYNAAIIEQARKYLGQKEIAGRASNPAIEAHFARAGYPGMTDDVPWCAAFVGSVLAEVGLKPSGSLMARSYATYGRRISQQDAQVGDIGVIARGNPPSGHVFFIAGFQGSDVLALGGNQSDEVNIKPIPLASIIHIRRADPMESEGYPTLAEGNSTRDPDVEKLQVALNGLGYPVGKVDGLFGRRVKDAVIKLQDAHGLDPDGVVGPKTWKAILKAKPAPKRDVTADDLRKRGSTTVKATDAQAAAAVIGFGGISIEAIRGALDTVQQGQGALEWLGAFVKDNWPLALVLGALAVAWFLAGRIRDERVRKAVSGADLSL